MNKSEHGWKNRDMKHLSDKEEGFYWQPWAVAIAIWLVFFVLLPSMRMP